MNEKIAYFAHDLADPAVRRRVRMLAAGGAAVTPMGFRRGAEPITVLEGIPAIEIGRSRDGRLVQRALSVLAALEKLRPLESHVRGSDVIMARNLEMLVLAAQARKRYAPTAKLVYECLDIHRMLLSRGLDGVLLRFLESRLWREVDLLVTSSPAFVRNYFVPRGCPTPVRLVENKVLLLEDECLPATSSKRPEGPPWRIGWFGMIRCQRSLDILSSVMRATGGAVEVIIRGRPSEATFPDFAKAIGGRPYVHYDGPYRNPDDLREIYHSVHFVWAIDFYESGENSAWLLPNRIYEGAAYGAVPIGLADVETGAWLAEHRVGVTFDEPLQEQLIEFFQHLDQANYAKLAQAVGTIPRANLVNDRMDCFDLVTALCRPSLESTAVHLSGEAGSVEIGAQSTSAGAKQ